MSRKLKTIALSEQGIEEFWAQVDRSQGEDACWPWLGSTYNPSAAGIYGDAGINAAHRVAYWVEYRRQPGKEVLRHNCDNTLCCNPKHLEPGTYAENIQDSIDRGRFHKLNPKKTRASLTKEDRVAIGTSKARARLIAAQYGVSRNYVFVLRRKYQPHKPNDTPMYAQLVAAYCPQREEN